MTRLLFSLVLLAGAIHGASTSDGSAVRLEGTRPPPLTQSRDASRRSQSVDCCAVLELWQYTLKPGQRDALVALFDRHFVESQEDVGMTIVGQFRDRQRPDRFVWIRGFPDMHSRHAALERFYGGPVWAEHKVAANATMVDVSDVHLLRPARSNTAFHLDVNSRPRVGEERKGVLVLAGIHYLRQAPDTSIVSRFEEQVVPELRRDKIEIDAIFVTEPANNTFDRLPVREGEHVLVWFSTSTRDGAPPSQALRKATAALSSLATNAPLAVLELEATPRSLLGHHHRAW
jgi:hypothetical protein